MSASDAHCPHCRKLLLADAPFPYPQRPVRCVGCRLLVGPGRSRALGGAPRVAPPTAVTTRLDAVTDVLRDQRIPPVGGDLRDSSAPHVL